MKIQLYKKTLICLLLFAGYASVAQMQYNTKAKKTETTIAGKTVKGYTTFFDFSREITRKGWWEYAKAFGAPLNMKTYYQVTIPSSTNDGNIDLVIYTQATTMTGGSEFFLGVEETQYDDQAKSLLFDFKKQFYIGRLVAQIKDKASKAKKLSEAYNDSYLESERSDFLTQITRLKNEIEVLKEQIRRIEQV